MRGADLTGAVDLAKAPALARPSLSLEPLAEFALVYCRVAKPDQFPNSLLGDWGSVWPDQIISLSGCSGSILVDYIGRCLATGDQWITRRFQVGSFSAPCDTVYPLDIHSRSLESCQDMRSIRYEKASSGLDYSAGLLLPGVVCL